MSWSPLAPTSFIPSRCPAHSGFSTNASARASDATKCFFSTHDIIYRQLDRAHRDFSPDQIELLANIARLYRGEAPESTNGSAARMQELFPDGTYADIAGLCRVATLQEIEAQGWSLNPGRYVGVAERALDDIDFKVKLESLNEELEVLNVEAHELEERISVNVAKLLEVEV